jgi:hypothetical protein
MKAGSFTALNCDARTNETEPGQGPKPQKRREKPQATGNRRLAEQIRKILGKHYASKYRVR